VHNIQEQQWSHLRRGGILKSLEFEKTKLFLKSCVPVSVSMLGCIRKLHEDLLDDFLISSFRRVLYVV
jgi:hypothetical protein